MKDKLDKILGFEVETTENPDFGDYSSNVALVGAKEKGENPRKVAEDLKEKLEKDVELGRIVDKIEVAGPGFINFFLKKDVLLNNLIQIGSEKEKYGSSTLGKDKTVVIDYSSPNIAKPFGIGHLRSTIIGQALYNLYKFLGYEVVGDNHLGDWGTQFGKLLYMIKTENSPELSIEILEKLYVEFHKEAETDPGLEEKAREWFRKLEGGNVEAKEIWQKCVDVSLSEFDRIYKRLGVNIDFAFGESYYETEMRQMLMDPGIKRHLTKGEGGATIIDLTKFGIKTPLMFLKKDGATTYATRDLATIKFRARKWDPSIIIYEVGAEQSLHFQQVFAAARLLGLVGKNVELIHTAHGLYLAPDGKKFSTRKGKTIKLEDVLDEATERAQKLGEKSSGPAYAKVTAVAVGIGAVKYFDLMHSVGSDVIFDWDKMMNLEGNSGPYLQYTVARCNSVIQKAATFKEPPQGYCDSLNSFKGVSSKGEYSNLNNEEMLMLRSLIRFPEVIISAVKSYSPNLLCNYLYDLASKFNAFYNKHKIIDSDQEKFRLTLTSGVGQVLKNGLHLLGIQTPERM